MYFFRETLSLPIGTLIKERYEVNNLMCHTRLAKVYEVTDTLKGDAKCVLKIRAFNNQSFHVESHYLEKCRRDRGFPYLVETFDFEADEEKYNCIVTSHEGETLLLHLTRRQFKISIANTLRIGYKVFCLLEKMHQKGYVHRDLQFRNILLEINYGGDIDVKLIDFEYTVEHSPAPECTGMIGWYVSLDVINGKPYTVLDDFTSLVCNLMACQGINPFGYKKDSYLELKKQFYNNPMEYFPEPETHWIGRLHLEIERQRTDGYDKSAIMDIFKNAVEGVSPTSAISYTYTEGRFYID